jgi:predicted O-methyltransferase YrrM
LPEHGDSRRLLEIGSFEGRSTVWMIENIMQPGDELVCVDTWAGGEEHSKINMGAVEARFDANVAKALDKFQHRALHKVKDTSTFAISREMKWIPVKNKAFDFIYIDGSHQAPDVLADAVMSWQILRMGGIMVFDDYMWGDPRVPLHRPKIAIDAFMNIFAAEMVVLHIGGQVAIKKQTP